MLSPSAETLLSYLVGLAPVGTPISPRYEWVAADLRIHRNTAYRALALLVASKAVERLAMAGGGMFGLLVVHKRPEAFRRPRRAREPIQVDHRVVPQFRQPIPTERMERRSLTAMIFGDPSFERSALYAKRAAEARHV